MTAEIDFNFARRNLLSEDECRHLDEQGRTDLDDIVQQIEKINGVKADVSQMARAVVHDIWDYRSRALRVCQK